MRRPETQPEGGVSKLRFYAECPFGEAYPHLFEFLVETRWEDGSSRTTGTLLLFAEEGRWKGCLHDRDIGRSAFLSGGSPEEVLEAFEAGLGGERLEWRVKPARTPSKAQGGK